MSINMPSLATFKRFVRDIAPAARAVLMARVHAEMERQRVNAYILPIFRSYGFTYGAIVADPALIGKTIDKPEHLYLCEDEARVTDYFAACDLAHRVHGFTGPAGHCPALRAENLVVKTENAMIELCQPLFGIECWQLYGENREKYLELLIGAALKSEQEN